MIITDHELCNYLVIAAVILQRIGKIADLGLDVAAELSLGASLTLTLAVGLRVSPSGNWEPFIDPSTGFRVQVPHSLIHMTCPFIIHFFPFHTIHVHSCSFVH
jgi:hypothetical protein